MEGVDDDRRPRADGEQHGEATDRARLRGVGVQDLGAEGAQQAGEPEDGERVPHRGDLAVKLLDRDDRDAERVGNERHRLLAPGEAAGHQRRVVAPVLQPCAEVGDVQRGAAHVQPRDDPHNSDGPLAASGSRRAKPGSASGAPGARPRIRQGGRPSGAGLPRA